MLLGFEKGRKFCIGSLHELDMSIHFNYKHLYYFWVVAKEGGMTKAAEKLNMAVQTVSAQVRELEKALGYALLKPVGRGLVLTEAGIAAMKQADLIFQLGEALPAHVRDAAMTPMSRLTVGICDSLPKMVAHRLLLPVMSAKNLKLTCLEGELDDLLGDLALHRLDIVLSDRPAPTNINLKLYSHALGTSDIALYGTKWMVKAARTDFPQSLSSVPILLPTSHTAVRDRLDRWFEQHHITPNVVGEFEDSALLKTFGAKGMGIFPAAEWVHDDLLSHYDVTRLGACAGVNEHFFAIGTERKVHHPLVQSLLLQKL